MSPAQSWITFNRLPLTVVLAAAAQLVAGIWWASALAERVTQHQAALHARIDSIERRQGDYDKAERDVLRELAELRVAARQQSEELVRLRAWMERRFGGGAPAIGIAPG